MGTKNTLADLRDHLFVTIEKLLDEDDPLEVETANAVAKVGATLIETAKVELKAMEIAGMRPSRFLDTGKKNLRLVGGAGGAL